MDYSIDLAVDTSALVAVLFQDAEAEAVLQQLSVSGRIGISAANKTELLMVVGSRLGRAGRDKALELLARYRIVTVPIDDRLAELAAQAFFNYGKGRHPAGLTWRLLLLRLSETSASAFAVQGGRFLENRYCPGNDQQPIMKHRIAR